MPTVMHGDFEWDEDKNLINQQKHDIAFEEAIIVFSGLVCFSNLYVHKTGEIRQYVVGFLYNSETTVVFTMRGGRRRIISARRSSREERDELYQRISFRA